MLYTDGACSFWGDGEKSDQTRFFGKISLATLHSGQRNKDLGTQRPSVAAPRLCGQVELFLVN